MALLASLFFAQGAEAKDLSLPYRNYPGFVCHAYNTRGECTDFSYFQGNVGNSYNYNYNNGYNYGNTYYDPYTGNGRVSVRVTAAPDPVEPDDFINYSIYVRNDLGSTRSVVVIADLDADTDFESASNGGRRSGGDQVRWTLSLRARSSSTVTLRVRVDEDLRDGDTVRLDVSADGSRDQVVTRVEDYDRYDDDDECNPRYDRCYYRNGRYYYEDDCDRYDDCDDDYYDDCDRYDDCDDDYDDCDRYDDCDDITVEVGASTGEVNDGQLLTYTIHLENDSSSDRRVDVNAFLDEETDFYSASDGGDDVRRDEVEWEDVYVGARSTRNLTVSVRVSRDVRSGDRIEFEAEADGDSDTVSTRVR